MKKKLLFGLLFLAFLVSFSSVIATVQPVVSLNQSNDFINQYSEMNFSITEYSGQKSIQYLNLTIPSGYALSVPAPGFQIGTWNITDPIIVASPTTFTIGTTGNITLYGNVLNLHLFNGDNPFAVNTADSTVLLQLYPFIWQNPSTQGIYVWNYTSLLAGDPQQYTSFLYQIIRDYYTNINNTFNNQYLSCTANVTLNNNNTLGVLVNFSSEINNTNLNINNITLQTFINNSNTFNLSIDLSNNNSIAIINENNNTLVNINNNSIINMISCDNNNSITTTTYFNGSVEFNASFWLSNNNTLTNLISCDSNSSAWISAMFNNTNIYNASLYVLNNNTNIFNASFDLSNNNSINILAAFNNTNTFNMTFDMSNNNTIIVTNNVNATANCMQNQNQSNYNNVTIIFNNTVLCSANSTTWLDASNQTTNYNVSLFSNLFSNTTLLMYFGYNNSIFYNLTLNLNNTFVTNINNTNTLTCDPYTNVTLFSYPTSSCGSTYSNTNFTYSLNNSVDIPAGLCASVNLTCPPMVSKTPIERYWPIGLAAVIAALGTMALFRIPKPSTDLLKDKPKTRPKQFHDEPETEVIYGKYAEEPEIPGAVKKQTGREAESSEPASREDKTRHKETRKSDFSHGPGE